MLKTKTLQTIVSFFSAWRVAGANNHNIKIRGGGAHGPLSRMAWDG